MFIEIGKRLNRVKKENIRSDKMINLKHVTKFDVEQLQKISIETFSDTFGADNSLEDMKQMFDNNYNVRKLTDEINNPQTDFEFIYLENELAGYLKINWGNAQSEPMGEEYLEIERIYIRKSFKRHGLGSRLMDYTFKIAQKLNKRYVWLGVWEHNVDAIRFYEVKDFHAFSDHIFIVGTDEQRDILMKRTIK